MYRSGNYYNGSAYRMAVYISTNKGASFPTVRYLGTGGSYQAGCYDVEVAPSNSAIVYAVGSDGYPCVFRSTNSGNTWTNVSGNLSSLHTYSDSSAVMAAFVHPTDPDIVVVGTSEGAFKTTNAGQSWSKTLSQYVVSFAYDPVGDYLFVGTYGQGVSLSLSKGDNWQDANEGLIGKKIVKLECNPDDHYLYAATDGGGLCRLFLVEATPTPQNTPTACSAVTNNWCSYE